MNIGDRVRSLSGNEEGIITKFLADRMMEVEIEEGFSIPFSQSDLVPISELEGQYFKDTSAPSRQSPRAALEVPKPKHQLSAKGIFILLTPFNDQLYDVHLANNTDLKLAMTLGHAHDGAYDGKYIGTLEARSSAKTHQLNMDKFEKWGKFVCHILLHQENTREPKPPMEAVFRLKAEAFFKAKTKAAPVIGGEAHVFQLDGDERKPVDAVTKKVSGQDIAEKMLAPNEEPEGLPIPKPAKPGASLEIDLHIEQLRPDHTDIPKHEMLDIQIQEFESALDAGVVKGLALMTFIHGAGAGTLRRNIQKRLSKHPHVSYFEDARKEKFGYGATTATLK